MSNNGNVANGSVIVANGQIYSETAKDIPEQTIFSSKEISQGSFDDDDGLEMVPVILALPPSKGPSASSTENDVFADERPSNEKLLCVAFVTFTTFTVFQTAAAFIAGSEAMMGDSGAMFVDAMTYLFNLLAERRKTRFEEYYKEPEYLNCVDPFRKAKLKKRAQRKMVLTMELIPPVVSVTTLLIVTGVVLHGSITVILLDEHRDRSAQGDPNLSLMLTFSFLNLLVDALNLCCFANAKRLCGYATSPKHIVPGSTDNSISGSPQPYAVQRYAQLNSRTDSGEMEDGFVIHAECNVECCKHQNASVQSKSLSESFMDESNNGSSLDFIYEPTVLSSNGEISKLKKHRHLFQRGDESDDDDNDGNQHEEANLNMCSAYTHVFADTLRSVAVIIAATVAELSDRVTSEEADAAAAVIVSVLILLSIIPLLSGLGLTFGELQSINAEEKDELRLLDTSSYVTDNS